MIALIFKYGTLLMLGISVGGILSGSFALGETLVGMVFTVAIVGGLALLCKKYLGISYPKFLNTQNKRRIADVVVFLVGVMAVFGSV